MAAPTDHPQTAAERLIATTIQWTWVLWLIGGLYPAGPALGWILALMACGRIYIAPGLPEDRRPGPLPATIWLWLAGMGAMLLVLWIGHSNFSLGTGQTIKSSVGWAKGWALLALFPFAGAVLRPRPQVIYRAISKLGLQSLILLPLFLVAPYVGLPGTLWVSPLKIVGGSGPEYFAAILYTLEPGVGTPRWQFFAPWSPAAGMVAVIYVLLAARDSSLTWRMTGIAAGLALAIFSQSRLALVAVLAIPPFVIFAARINRPSSWMAAAPIALFAGFFGPAINAFIGQMVSDFAAARADSSRVRATLGRIALDRWQTEAPIFGHGVVENGPHLVEYMPIGSHHTWYGLLFVKGLAGAAALAAPLFASFAVLFWRARQSQLQRTGLGMVCVLILYSFGENLEALAYLIWPALVILGCALGEKLSKAD
ncbi:capsular biosynthesis protein [Erythrobacter sp. SG61-1L]|uniref:capsular biosynthesis protein n=1 Tax=Erythrobacter sp. SG61-1L TaxID=1603897 RepID=UPI0006C8ED7B|nr:capsular biosynthesis protein [Erythrobacter sp. SG61-1L]KPL68428.1 capsular biosynthesis protein [Erythrobacter sp. SG61-1L]